jgi:hypothetical protein
MRIICEYTHKTLFVNGRLKMEELGNRVEVRDLAKVLGIPLGANRIGFIDIKDLSTIFGNS